MLGFYNLSLQGLSHVSSGKVCQDASNIVRLSNGWICAAIADGVGSSRLADIGASTAVNTVIEYVNNQALEEWDTEQLCDVLKTAYQFALNKICEISENEGNPINDYNTTLTAAIYNGEQIVYGHVGDGGIIVLSETGEYSQLTAVQKGEEFNCVEPLKSENAWKFGCSDTNVCAFSMFTDGIYDVVCPWILADKAQKIYVNYVRLFMDMNVISAVSEEDFENLKANAEKFLTSDYNSNITDDKTIAVVVNTDVIPKLQPEEYYFEPDWEALQNEHKKHLYNSEQ